MKDAYLDYKGFSKEESNTRACFKKAEQYEKVLNKDLSEWTAAEIIEFYKSFCSPSVDFLYNVHSVYKAYTNWCLQEHLLKDNINHYNEITQDILLKCINKGIADKRIISRENLLQEIQRFNNPRDQFVCLACFEGLAGKELEEVINAKLSKFYKGNITTSTGRIIPYSSELLRYATDAANTYVYTVTTSNSKIRNFTMIGDADQIVKKVISKDKDLEDNEVKPQVIYVKLKDIQRDTNIPAFTTKALKESGRIHKIKEYMANDSSLTLEKAIKKSMDIYGGLLSISAYINKYKDFLM